MFRFCHEWLPKRDRKILGTHLQVSVHRVHILTWGEMNASCWLVENDIMIIDVTNKFQQMALLMNYEITVNTAKGDEEGRWIITLADKYVSTTAWSWLYGSWIYNYLCNQYLSPLKLWVRIPLGCVLDTTLCDKVCQWLAISQ